MRLWGISPRACTAALTCSSGEARLLPMAIYARVMPCLHDAVRAYAGDGDDGAVLAHNPDP